MERTTPEVPDDLDARLRHEAARRGVAVSDVSREMIEPSLGAAGGRRQLGVAAGRSGHDDVSERIEEVLTAEVSP